MKNILFILLSGFLIFSCSPKDKLANDAAGIKAQLKSKKTEIKSLEADLDTLNARLLVLEPRKEKDPILITTKALKKEDFNRFTTVQGAVQSDEKAYASSETGGRIISVNAKEGDYVQRGQLLATVDLSTINNQIAEIETGLSLAKDVYQRQKRLWDQKIGTEVQYLQAKNNVERMEKSIATLKSQLNKANVTSPISGIVDMEMLKAGEMASPGMPILKILNTGKLKVVSDVPETYLTSIKRGDNVDVYFPALDLPLKKKVSMIGRSIDPSNRTFKVEVNTGSQGGKLKPNLLAELKFNDFSKKDALTIPIEVILEEVDGTKYVWVMADKESKKVAQKKYVTPGESYENEIIIEEGLAEGDRVIIDGARTVTEGALVISKNN